MSHLRQKPRPPDCGGAVMSGKAGPAAALFSKTHEEAGGSDQDGSYRGTGTGFSGDLTVEVTVEDATGQQINRQGRRIRGVVGDFGHGVGNGYYVEKSMTELRNLTRQEWQTQLAGRMFSTDSALRVTPYEELRSFIQEELGELFVEEAQK